MFCQVGHTNSVTFATFGLVWQEKWREQNHRHLTHNIPPHHALGSSTRQSMGCQSLQVSGTLRSRVIQRSEHMSQRAAGIELAHSEGQRVIHFLWDSSWEQRGYPLEILVLGSLTHKSPRCLQVGKRIQRHHQWLCIQHSGRLSPELLLGQRPNF